jgi:hypothetical protein
VVQGIRRGNAAAAANCDTAIEMQLAGAIRHKFQAVDADNDLWITAQQFARLLLGMGERLSASELGAALKVEGVLCCISLLN